MKKTKFWLLGIILALIYSCSDDFETKEQSPQGLEISEAQSYFEKNATDLAPLTFSSPSLSRSANLTLPELVPEWDKAIQSENEDYFITEIPLRAQSDAICIERITKDAEFLCENKILCQRRLVIARQKDGDTTDMFIATLVPDKEEAGNGEELFTGRVFYSELNGNFRKAVGYKNGELQKPLLIGKALTFAVYTREGAPLDYSTLAFQESSTLRSATYSNSESGGGGGWDPGWGGGGAGGGGIGGGGTGGGSGTGGGGGGSGYDPDYELGERAYSKIMENLGNENLQMTQLEMRGGHPVLGVIGIGVNHKGIIASCFNFMNQNHLPSVVKQFGKRVGILGVALGVTQTVIALYEGNMSATTAMDALSTALGFLSLRAAAFGAFPLAGFLGVTGCVLGIVSGIISLTQTMLIKIPVQDGNIYLYISPNEFSVV